MGKDKNVNIKNKTMTSQSKEVLKYMQTHPYITSMIAINEFGATRLSAIIYDLRKAGYNIVTLMVEGKNRYGRDIKYARYVLTTDREIKSPEINMEVEVNAR